MTTAQADPEQGGTRRSRRVATIYDVAEATGLDPSTVSRALRGTGRVSQATRDRVTAAARELGYQANQLARALNSGRTHTLALMVADITNPLVFEMIRGAENTASERGYTLVIAESRESREAEAAALARVSPNVDGVLLAFSRLGEDEIRRAAEQVPLAVLNRVVDGVACLMPDLESGTRELVEHLASLGHTSIGYVGGPDTIDMGPRRHAMLQALADEKGLALHAVGPYPPTQAGGRDAVEDVVGLDVTAVIAFNDLVAIGLLGALRRRGVSVPDDLSVVGFDDIFGSDFTTPTLTTVGAPVGTLAASGVEAVLAVAAGAEVPTLPDLPSYVVVRESASPPRG